MRLGNEFQIYGSFDNVEENKIWDNINMIASMKKSQHSSIAKQHFSCSKVKQLQYAKCHTRNLSDTHQQTIFFLSSSSPYSPSAFSTGLIRGFHCDSHTIAHLHFCFHSHELTPSYVTENNHIHEIAADKSFFVRNSSTEPPQWLPTDFHQLPTVGGCRCVHNNWSMSL